MCGRFVADITAKQLSSAYQLQPVPDFPPRYNIAPSQKVAVVRVSEDQIRELAFLKWGLIPPWAKDASIGHKLINARSETLHEKPSFKNAFRSRRCIIPASGFYEWDHRGEEKTPHYIRPLGGGILSMAGLWESWRSSDGEIVETCTIITTEANDLIRPLHNRMPSLIYDQDIELWLTGGEGELSALSALLKPTRSNLFEEWSVSKAVNSPSYDQLDCLTPTSMIDV